MRFTSTTRFYLVTLSVCFLLVFLLIYIPQFLSDDTIETIKTIAGFTFILVVGVPILYILYSILTLSNEYASGILRVYNDVNDKDLHLFTTLGISRAKSGQSRLRMIQHYFILTDTGKVYYRELFSHSTASVSGSGNYDGYTSFEEDVLTSEELKESLAKFSHETKMALALGDKLNCLQDEKLYAINQTRELRFDRVAKLFQDQIYAVYVDKESGNDLWRVKI